MTHKWCELHFAGEEDVQLDKVLFTDPDTEVQSTTVRGSTAGVWFNAGTFRWTSAVRALCILLARTKVMCVCGSAETESFLSGERGSLASSLDYAISKRPVWLREMFGNDEHGNSLCQKLIIRTNPSQKRVGPVVLALNQRSLPGDNIFLVLNGQKVESNEGLKTLLLRLESTMRPRYSSSSDLDCTTLVAA
jgi:hypothetical protein